MCEPVTSSLVTAGYMSASTAATIATVVSVGQVAGLAMSAYGVYADSQAQKDQANYQAGVARNNKIISDRNAADITKQGKDEANRYRARVRQLEAQQTVSLVAQGADVTEGSNVDLLADTAELGEFDAQIIESNAGRAAYNARVEGMNFQAQAGLYKAKANAQMPAFSGATTLLSGAGQVNNRWNSTKKAGN